MKLTGWNKIKQFSGHQGFQLYLLQRSRANPLPAPEGFDSFMEGFCVMFPGSRAIQEERWLVVQLVDGKMENHDGKPFKKLEELPTLQRTQATKIYAKKLQEIKEEYLL